MHVAIYKYINVGGSLCKNIRVKLRWHACMLREFKLMTFIGFHLYCYIAFISR
jgi:hypothetical protein